MSSQDSTPKKRRWEDGEDAANNSPPQQASPTKAVHRGSSPDGGAYAPPPLAPEAQQPAYAATPESYTKDVDINHSTHRQVLAKGSTHKLVMDVAAVEVTTRGRYYPRVEEATSEDPALHLHVEATTQEALDQAVAMIERMKLEGVPGQPTPSEEGASGHGSGPYGGDRFRSGRSGSGTPHRLQDKVFIDVESERGFNVRAKLIGTGGENMKYIQNTTGARVQVRGRGSGYAESQMGPDGREEPMHLLVMADSEDVLGQASNYCRSLADTIHAQYNEFKEGGGRRGDRYGRDSHGYRDSDRHGYRDNDRYGRDRYGYGRSRDDSRSQQHPQTSYDQTYAQAYAQPHYAAAQYGAPGGEAGQPAAAAVAGGGADNGTAAAYEEYANYCAQYYQYYGTYPDYSAYYGHADANAAQYQYPSQPPSAHAPDAGQANDSSAAVDSPDQAGYHSVPPPSSYSETRRKRDKRAREVDDAAVDENPPQKRRKIGWSSNYPTVDRVLDIEVRPPNTPGSDSDGAVLEPAIVNQPMDPGQDASSDDAHAQMPAATQPQIYVEHIVSQLATPEGVDTSSVLPAHATSAADPPVPAVAIPVIPPEYVWPDAMQHLLDGISTGAPSPQFTWSDVFVSAVPEAPDADPGQHEGEGAIMYTAYEGPSPAQSLVEIPVVGKVTIPSAPDVTPRLPKAANLAASPASEVLDDVRHNVDAHDVDEDAECEELLRGMQDCSVLYREVPSDEVRHSQAATPAMPPADQGVNTAQVLTKVLSDEQPPANNVPDVARPELEAMQATVPSANEEPPIDTPLGRAHAAYAARRNPSTSEPQSEASVHVLEEAQMILGKCKLYNGCEHAFYMTRPVDEMLAGAGYEAARHLDESLEACIADNKAGVALSMRVSDAIVQRFLRRAGLAMSHDSEDPTDDAKEFARCQNDLAHVFRPLVTQSAASLAKACGQYGMYRCIEGLQHFINGAISRYIRNVARPSDIRLVMPFEDAYNTGVDVSDTQRPQFGFGLGTIESGERTVPGRPRYSEVFLPIEVAVAEDPSGPSEDLSRALLRLLARVTRLNRTMPNRRFNWGMCVYGSAVYIYLFARRRILESYEFDLRTVEGRRSYIEWMTNLTFCGMHQRGFDTSMRWLSGSSCWAIDVPMYKECPVLGRLYVGPRTFYAYDAFLSRGDISGDELRCFQAASALPARPGDALHLDTFIKDVWVRDDSQFVALGFRGEVAFLQQVKALLADRPELVGYLPSMIAGGPAQIPMGIGNAPDDIDSVLNRSLQEERGSEVHTRIAIAGINQPLDGVESAYEAILAVADAAYAHRELHDRQGVLHGDISSNNVMFVRDNDGRVVGRLIDLDNSVDATVAREGTKGLKGGTAPFMSYNNLVHAPSPRTAVDDMESFHCLLSWLLVRGPVPRHRRSSGARGSFLNVWNRGDECAAELKAAMMASRATLYEYLQKFRADREDFATKDYGYDVLIHLILDLRDTLYDNQSVDKAARGVSSWAYAARSDPDTVAIIHRDFVQKLGDYARRVRERHL
ncbi:hypothetical protein GGF46_004316 [Coemansia sp. RSA 552]|nr:hypothetical protein GGF46_004316 [Coemansia sp. RSA 552]